jgi:Fe/S biogenesis protein NfuA
VRWVVPAGSLPAGLVRRAPGALGAMFDDGTLAAGLVEHTAVWLWLSEGQSWSRHGRAVQAALPGALAEPDGWTVQPAPGEVLERVIADLLAGSVGEVVRSHGGSVSARRIGPDTVAVELGGACEHCAAAVVTLRQRLLGELRRRCPDLVETGAEGTRLTLTLSG